MENAYLINGGKILKGEVKLSGAKNVALKTIIGALLFDSPVVLHNIPRINDVFELLHLIRSLGAKADFTDVNTILIDGLAINSNKVDLLHASKIRVSVLLFAPLLHRFGKCYIPNPGGCRIGARPIDRIVAGINALGVTTVYNHETGYYEAAVKTRISGKYRFNKISHTGTEMLILMSVFCRDEIVIDNVAREPEIDDLIAFLNQGGAKIRRVDSQIIINGISRLSQVNPYHIMTDRNEAITYAVMGLATRGDVTIYPILKPSIKTFLEKLKLAGAEVHNRDDHWRFIYQKPLRATDVETSPYPGFMTDWQPNWAVLMTQAVGDTIIHERVFENRFAYVEEIRKLGGEIDYVKIPVTNPAEYFYFNFNPQQKYNQAIRIKGSQSLHGGVMTVADLRAGASLAIAALTATGESVVNGVSMLERGYENFVEKVSKLGGEIKKL